MTWQIESFTDVGGNKDQEFVKYIDLPSRTAQPFELAINGPQKLLREHGWATVDAMGVSRTLWDYREFIHRSQAEFGVAKHTYVATPLRLVQRSHGVLSGIGTAGAGAGYRLERPPAARRGAAGVLVARRGAGRHRSHQQRLRRARPARGRNCRANISRRRAS